MNVVRAVRLVGPLMKAQGGGAIINISTAWAFEPSAGFPTSAVFRAGLAAYTKIFADTYAPDTVRMANATSSLAGSTACRPPRSGVRAFRLMGWTVWRPERHPRAKMVVVKTPSEGKPSMGKSIRNLSTVTRVGLDLAKRVFQVHAVEAKARSLLARKLTRSQLIPFFAELPPCVVAMEACGLGAPLGAGR